MRRTLASLIIVSTLLSPFLAHAQTQESLMRELLAKLQALVSLMSSPLASVSPAQLVAQASGASSLVAAYDFDEGSGTTLTDRSGNGNSGTLMNGPAWTTGKNGGALQFDGVNDRVNVPGSDAVDLRSSMTISAWISPASFPAYGSTKTIVFNEVSGNYLYTFGLYGESTGPVLLFTPGGGAMHNYSSILSLSANQWAHIAVSFDRSANLVRFYLNGVLSGQSTDPVSGGYAFGAGTLHIGSAGTEEFFLGRIDDLRIYNRALSASEIQTDMNTPISGAPSGGGGSGSGTPAPASDTTAPSTPTNLVATAQSASSVSLSWAPSSDNVGVTGYRIYQNGVQVQTTSSLGYEIPGLAPSTTYSFSVAAVDAAGNVSAQSAPASVTTMALPGVPALADTTAPTAPGAPSASNITQTGVTLSWGASTDAVGVTGYRLERCQGSGCTAYTQIATPSTTSYTDSALTAATTYRYRVRATDQAGNLSGYSPETSVTTQSAAPAPGGTFVPPYALPAIGQAVAIGVNTLNDITPPGFAPSGWTDSIFVSYGGGTFVPDYSAGGAWVAAATGGHNHPDNPGAAIFDFADATWKRRDNSAGIPYRLDGYNGYQASTFSNGAPYYEFTGTQVPLPAHPYVHSAPIPASRGGGAQGSVILVSRAAIGVESLFSGSVHRFDLATGEWKRATNNLSSRFTVEGQTVYDALRNRYWVFTNADHNYQSLYYLDATDWTFKTTASFSGGWPPTDIHEGRVFLHLDRYIVRHTSNQKLYAIDLENIAAGWKALSVVGTLPPSNVNAFAPWRGKYYWLPTSGGNTFYRLIPPADPIRGTWIADTVSINTNLPPHPGNGLVQHYTSLFFVPSIDALAWVVGGSNKVFIIRPDATSPSSPTPQPQPTPDTTAPTAPGTPSASNVTQTGVTLSWGASTDAVGVTGYRLERCQGSGCTAYTQIATPSTTSYTDSALTSATTYRYRVRATDQAGNLSGYSPETSVTTQSAAPAPVSGAVTSFVLTSLQTGTQIPFTVGLGFKKGDVPANASLDISDQQVVVMRRWNDGSVKHAIASGHIALTANIPRTISVLNSQSTSGSALTPAAIQAASPQASVSLGTYGTVNLSSLLSSPVRTFVAGPEMIEAHYRSSIGADPAFQVWFHVRYYKSGRTWIRVVVENGSLDTANSNKTYVPNVVIGGTTVFNNGGVAMTHYRNTRWSAEGWVGGNVEVTPKHDTAYLMSTKLVPNYWIRPPTASRLNGLYQQYAYGQNGGWEPLMGAAGYQDQIGLLPLWDAMYFTSGADARAYRSVLANAQALNSYATVWNDSVTKQTVRPSDRPSWTIFGPNQGGGDVPQVGSLHWEIAHHGSGGYLAYLLTGDRYYLETMANQAALCYLTQSVSQGLGTSRLMQGQTRAMAWCYRTVGQFAGIGADDPVVADYRTLLQNNIAYLNTLRLTPGMNELGFLYDYGANGTLPYQSKDGTYTSTSPWQQHFKIQALGHVSDLEPFTDMSVWNAARDHLYRAVVGILGSSGSSSYCYTKANSYTIKVTSDQASSLDLRTWYDSWGQVYQATHGSNANCGATLDGADYSVATGYWANLLPAISYAVDHGASGAAAAWSRLTSATNWDSNSSIWNFSEVPIWGILPRAGVSVTPTPQPQPTPDTTAPTAPGTPSASNVTQTGVTLSWGASTDAVGVTGYRLERCQGSGCTAYTQIATPSTTSYTDSALTAATTYRYRVRATDQAGNLSGYSPETSVTTQSAASAVGDTTAPTAPANLIVLALDRTTARLTWSASTDDVGVTGYRIERCRGSNCTGFVEVAQLLANTADQAGLSGSTTYRYRVRATDQAGNPSGYSAIVNVAMPGTLGGSTKFTSSARVSVVSEANVRSFPSTSGVLLGTQSAGALGTIVGGPFNRNGFLWWLVDYDIGPDGWTSETLLSPSSPTPQPQPTPDTTAPTAPGTPSASNVTQTGVTLSWGASTDAVGVTGYRLERCQGSGCTAYTQIATPSTTSYTDSALTSATTYRYRVRATDQAGNLSGYSPETSVTTEFAPVSTSIPPPSSGGGGGGGSAPAPTPAPTLSSGGGEGFIPPAPAPTPLPTPVFSAPAFTKPLYPGVTDPEVRTLQELLLKKGLLPSDAVTGTYGPLTQQAVEAYQCQNGIVCSGTAASSGYGLVGASTRARLNQDWYGSASSGGSVAPTPAVTPITKFLVPGMKDKEVVILQNFLIGKNLLPADSATGFFGPATQAALKKYQCASSIVCTGTPLSTGYGAVGPKTRSSINQAMGATSAQIGTALSETERQALIQALTLQIQALLKQLEAMRAAGMR